MANMTGQPWANMGSPKEVMDNAMFSSLSFENLDFSNHAESHNFPITAAAIVQP
jgi:hypothetical protein